ncbi:MAG: hypothetical protein K1X79_04450 [Oligoflexia bacterium]|nr:hypothetical protein [Oligoflexia bacterium]
MLTRPNAKHFFTAGLFFAISGLTAERCFWLVVGANPGWQWAAMISVWSFIIGGLVGRRLLGEKVSLKHIFMSGFGIPCLTLYASGVSFGLGPALANIFSDSPMDGFKQMLFSPFLGLVVAGSGFLVTFWLIIPVGVCASWVLSLFGSVRGNKKGHNNSRDSGGETA